MPIKLPWRCRKKIVCVLAHDDLKPKEILYTYIIILSVEEGGVQLLGFWGFSGSSGSKVHKSHQRLFPLVPAEPTLHTATSRQVVITGFNYMTHLITNVQLCFTF